MPKQKRLFVVRIEAELEVDAFDATSAQRKVERAFAEGRLVHSDVTTTGRLWVYEPAPADET